MSAIARRLSWLLLIPVALATFASVSTRGHAAPNPEPPVMVTTLAGDGSVGNRDGAAHQADFMYPSGVAYDARSGDVYVADAAAQRIRRITRSGVVETVAGTGTPTRSGLEILGGYADGPAASARFRRPSAVALGPDGTLYIADSFNHCIRRLRNGVVDTFAGDPNHPGNKDGARTEATFTEPRSLSFGRDGTLYVADFSVGIRTISPSGEVATLHQPWADVFDVSVWDHGPRFLFATTKWEGVVRYDLATLEMQRVLDTAQHLGYLHPYAVAALNSTEAIVTSSHWQVVDVVHFQGKPEDPPAFSALVAGEDDRNTYGLGGFADGQGLVARFFDPVGLTLTPAGDLLVADGGNRRIRVLSHVRGAELTYSGDSAPTPAPGMLRIALAANTENWDWLQPQSIAGVLQGRMSGVQVTAVRLNRDWSGAEESRLEFTASHRFDVVVWIVDAATVLQIRAEDVEKLNAFLKQSNTRLLVVERPSAAQLGQSEATYFQLFDATPAPADQTPFATLNATLSRLGIDRLDPLPDLIGAERGKHEPIYSPDADRLSRYGNEFMATLIERRVRQDAPAR